MSLGTNRIVGSSADVEPVRFRCSSREQFPKSCSGCKFCIGNRDPSLLPLLEPAHLRNIQISLLIPKTVIRQAQSVAALLLRQALAMMTWLRQAPAKVSLRCLAPPTVTLLQSALAMLRPLCLAFTSPLCQSRNRRSHRAPSPKGHLHLSAREATEARS